MLWLTVNPPGTYYSLDSSSGVASATPCPVDTFGIGLKKQRQCVGCPSGYTTASVSGASSLSQCGEWGHSCSYLVCCKTDKLQDKETEQTGFDVASLCMLACRAGKLRQDTSCPASL